MGIRIITIDRFDSYTLLETGSLKVLQENDEKDIVRVIVPMNASAIISNQSAVIDMITEPGNYDFDESVPGKVLFVNCREITNIKFGTKGPQTYRDMFYNMDLEIFSYGNFAIKVVDPLLFVQSFVPQNTGHVSFDNLKLRSILIPEFIQSYMNAISFLSEKLRIAQLSMYANELTNLINKDGSGAGLWEQRYGFKVVNVNVENIEYSDKSKLSVTKLEGSQRKMENFHTISQSIHNTGIAQDIGAAIGAGASMIKNKDIKGNLEALGGSIGRHIQKTENTQPENNNVIYCNEVKEVTAKQDVIDIPEEDIVMVSEAKTESTQQTEQKPALSFEEQIEMLKKLKDLMDSGILTKEEFNAKKREIMGLN